MRNKISNLRFKRLRHIASLPFILGMALPIVILDLIIEIYHNICFPLYGIQKVKRSNYIRIDQQKLSYLVTKDKLWCIYCGYVNGFAAYFVKIAGDTEKYWCGIKHKSGGDFIEQPHQKDFLEYGDEKAYDDYISSK